MVVQNEEKEKNCCFYVSDYHLEMILLPYINKKIDENISIFSEKNLKDTIEVLLSKMNLDEKNKQKILSLEWDGEGKIKENSNMIIIGSKQYIENKNKELNDFAVSVLDCYDFEKEKEEIHTIMPKYKNTLNTIGKNYF